MAEKAGPAEEAGVNFKSCGSERIWGGGVPDLEEQKAGGFEAFDRGTADLWS